MFGFFATRREFKRLLRQEKILSERCVLLEKELKAANDLRFERELLLIDRILTSTVKTFAIADEAEHKTFLKDTEAVAAQEKAELNEYLQRKRNELRADALEANAPEADAETLYRQNEPFYIEAYKEANGF